jgi:membrane protease YdiL (CAAX protease family)
LDNLEKGNTMNQTTESIVKERDAASTAIASRTTIILTAWLGTLLMSRLPQIMLSEFGVINSSDWSLWWWIMIGAGLLALTYIWAVLRPLRGYFLIMMMIYLFTILLSLLEQTSIWISWFGSPKPWLTSFFGERLGVVLIALGLAGSLALFGQKRENFFFAFGNVNAPAFGKRLTWKFAGPLIALPLTGLIAIAIFAMNPNTTSMIADALPLLPAVFLLALMNAFGEEMAFRAAPLSQLWEVVGKGQAIWMVALWFGLGHYYNGVSFGLVGVMYLTLVAVLFGKAMIDTKGLAVPVFMHLWGDVVVYIFMVQSSA